MSSFRNLIHIILLSLFTLGSVFTSAQESAFHRLFQKAYDCRECADSIQISLYTAAIEEGISDSTDLNNFHNALVNRAQLAGENGDPEMAVRDYTLALGVKPDYYKVRQELGTLYLENSKYKKAIEQFDIFIRRVEMEKEDLVESLDGDTEQIVDMRKEIILEMNEKLAPAYNNQGLARVYSGDHAGACEDFREAYELGMEELKNFLDKECSE